MSDPGKHACPACGAQASGKFCPACGASLEARACAGCGGSLGAGAQFCSRCGRRAGSGTGGRAERLRWILTGAAGAGVVAGLLVLLTRGAPATAATAEGNSPFGAVSAGAGSPPDISNMSPRERFDRLYNRIMTAAENGDDGTVTSFTPMALSAYGMLDTIDADARYHAALLKLHTGDINGATALGDSILAQTPGHLFGYVVLGTVARFRKDDPALKRAYGDFLKHYDPEMKAGRGEYEDHSRSLTDFKQAAEAARQTP